jgi:pimeloyl-ACP methyl ester carboxylesterase
MSKNISTTDTMESPNRTPMDRVSSEVYTIAGISTTIYGLSEVPNNVNRTACIWLHHPRGATYKYMESVAVDAIRRWTAFQSKSSHSSGCGLVAIAFDQRNHGSRVANDLANQAWKSGNATHAQDMYSIYQGTAIDTKLILDHLPSYLPASIPTPSIHMVLGISLGGHSAWHCLFNYPEFTSGVVIIGCCDYPMLMADRAVKSKLSTCTDTQPPGISIFGSESFPDALYTVVKEYDPASMLRTRLGLQGPTERFPEAAHEFGVTLLTDRLGGKKILNLAGREDQLVPYACSESFMTYLMSVQKQQTQDHKPLNVQHASFPRIGHAVSNEMHDLAVDFLLESLDPEYDATQKARQAFKM